MKYAGVNVYIKNLNEEVDDEKLRGLFGKFGNITSAVVMKDAATGKSKGFGFVCFSSTEEANRAVMGMNGQMQDGKPLYVALAQLREARKAQLEAQHQHRLKAGAGYPQIYSQGAPMYFHGQQRFLGFPPQMMARNMVQGAGYPQMGMPGAPFQLMPMNAQGGRGGSVARGGSRRGGRQPNVQQGGAPAGRMGGMPPQMMQVNKPNVRYGENVRNTQQPMMQPIAAITGAQPEEDSAAIKALASAPEDQKKRLIGEKLYPLVQASQPTLAPKITGMLLEMDSGELIHLLESNDALQEKIKEAIDVLQSTTEGWSENQ